MEEKLLRELSELHAAIKSITEARDHLYAAQSFAGTTANVKRALEDLETARTMLVADLEFTYRKATAGVFPMGRSNGR